MEDDPELEEDDEDEENHSPENIWSIEELTNHL